MDLYKLRQELRTKRINDIPLRVVYYTRVSTDSDEQLNSLENQTNYFENYIKANPCWTLVKGYVEEGVSGISTAKRDKFNEMMNDARLKKFDLILAKEVSRFARNTIDSINYFRELLSLGIVVQFLDGNMKTYEEGSELMLTILAGIAQDESRKISSRVKFGHKESIKRGRVLGNDNIFGYRKDHGKLRIDESQAPIVKELFEMYSTNKYSMKNIEDYFWDKGIRNTKGNRLSHSTMSEIIRNPKYKGYYAGGKVVIEDMFTKKQRFLPESQWVTFKDETGDIVPAIVSEETWERANKILEARSKQVKSKSSSMKNNLYTNILYCKEHDTPFYKKQNVKSDKTTYDPFWKCSHKLQYGAKTCPTPPIYESELNQIILDTFKDYIPNIDNVLNNLETLLMESNVDKNIQSEMNNIQNKIDKINNKKDKLFDLYTDSLISKQEFKTKNDLLNEDLNNLNSKLVELKGNEVTNDILRKEIKDIKKQLKNYFSNGKIELNKETINKLIDRIYVGVNGENELTFDIKMRIPTSDENDKSHVYALPTVCRSGHTIKKMIQSYENSLK